MELDDWLRAVAAELDLGDVDFSNDTVHTLLDLARDSAHEIERIAAPLTTYLVGCRRRPRGHPRGGRRADHRAGSAPPASPAGQRNRRLTWGRAPTLGAMGPPHRLRGRARRRVRQPRRLATGSARPAAERATRRRVSNEQAPVAAGGRGLRTGRSAKPTSGRRRRATGTFDAEHQFVIRYRNNGGEEGYQVVTPLRTDIGALLVDRGFVALPRGTPIPSTRTGPAGRDGHGRGLRPTQRTGQPGRRPAGERAGAADQLRRPAVGPALPGRQRLPQRPRPSIRRSPVSSSRSCRRSSTRGRTSGTPSSGSCSPASGSWASSSSSGPIFAIAGWPRPESRPRIELLPRRQHLVPVSPRGSRTERTRLRRDRGQQRAGAGDGGGVGGRGRPGGAGGAPGGRARRGSSRRWARTTRGPSSAI